MKKLISLFTLSFCFLFMAMNAKAQINVTGSNGLDATYTTFTDAAGVFAAFNGGPSQSGFTILITITSDVSGETGVNLLNAGLWNSVTINPSGARTVSGSVAGNALLTMNGADNVIIDGLNSSGNSLIISNTSTSSTSGTSTIKFITDATNNKVRNCSILGSATVVVSSGTGGGNLWFAAGAVSTGNDGNTISNCDIGPAGANLPTRLVWFNGTTTTVPLNNSNDTIRNCNLFDFFIATAQSRAIDVSGGNTDLVFSDNKIYQTATRTWTTGAEMRGISISNSSSGNNFQVTGNTIGFANSSGTGTYTITGGANLFKGIHLIVAGTTASNIQNNTVAGISQTTTASGTTTSSPCNLIYPQTGLITTTGNTIGSLSGTGSISYSSSSTSASDVMGIFNFSSQNSLISNNNIGSITATNSSTGAIVIYGIRTDLISTVTATISGNTIGGATAGSISNNATSTSSRIVGIINVTGIGSISGNTISNMTMSAANIGTGSSASIIGISQTASAAGQNVSQNTVSILSNTNATAAVVVTGISNSGSTTGSANLFTRNFIHSLSISSTSATAQINGLVSTAGVTTYQNNMIDLGIDAAGVSILSGLISGINELVGTNNFYFNSIYVGGSGVGGSSNSFAFQSAVTVNVRNYRDNIFYNARSNGAGTGKHYAVKVGGTAPNPTGLTINNNVYLANGTGAVFGFFNSLDVANFAAWKTAVGQDANSFNSDPQYLLPAGTAATVDLHINPSIATVIEGNGFNIGSITTDFDGQTRASLTPVDIGADAGNFIGVDLTGPVISYTALGNTSSLSNRNLTANITDAGGVDGGTNVPRLYYKKSTDAGWVFDNAPGISGSDYTWTIDYTLVGGGSVSVGETIQYYVAAQDVFGNLTTSPTGGSGINPPGTTPPGTPAQYLITNPPLAGDYTVGVTLFNRITGRNITFEKVTKIVTKEVLETETTVPQYDKNRNSENDVSSLLYNSEGRKVIKEVEEISVVPMENGKVYTGPLFVKRSENSNLPDEARAGIYATITAAVADLNLVGSSAAVRFLLTDNAYNTGLGESFPIIISYSTASAVNTLTIQPASTVTTVISGSSASGLFASFDPYVTFQGDNDGGTVNRDMTINNTNSATNTYVIGLFNGGGLFVANNNTIQNCNITGGSTSATNNIFGIILNAAGGNFDNVVIDNNVITQVKFGMQFAGVSGAVTDNGQITNNTIGSTTDALSCYGQGILLSFANNTTISNNEIIGQVLGNTSLGSATATSGLAGISIINSSTNTKIRKNKIHDFYYNGTGGLGAFGIAYGPGATTNTGTTEISNNSIYNIKGDGDQETSSPANMGWLAQGICIYNNGTAPVQIYYNSIYMSGAVLGSGFGGGSSAVIGIANTVGTGSIDMRNNALQNSQTAITTAGEAMGVWVAGSGSLNTIFSNINYNDYFVNGNLPQLGYFNSFRVDLAAWKTATGQDSYSYSGNPGFTSTSDLLPLVSSTDCWYLNGNGIALSGFGTDINGNTRSTTIAGGGTDIGAYEFTPSVAPPVISVIPSVSPLAVSDFILGQETVASIDLTTLGSLTGVDLQYYSGTVPPGLPGSPPVTDGYGNVYWDIQPTGTGFTYDLTIHYSPALLGNTVESAIKVAIQDPPNNPDGFYTPYPQGTGTAQSDVDLVNHNIKVRGLTAMGKFIITDANSALPVELASFVSAINGRNVTLNWATSSEENNSGFDVERSTVNGSWTKIGNVAGNGTTSNGHSYSITDRNLSSGNYNYRLKQIDFNGNFKYYNLSNEVIVGVPEKYELSQNYPNPFNPSTKISYDIPFDGKVSLTVFDMSGKEIVSLVNEVKTAGYYTVNFNASNLSSGTYFYRINAEGNGQNFVSTKKMMLVK